jgi:peptide/nickel transport system substrate-binding protein
MDLKIGPALMLLTGLLLGSPCAVAAETALNTNAVIIYYDSSGNATLDPAEPQNGSSYSHETLLALYETLIRFDQDGNLTPGLAQSWEMSPDLMQLTLDLRPGATFHDGTKVNAEAVKRNFERNAALGRKAGNVVADTARLIKTIETIGENKVKLTLTEPSGQIELRLAYNSGMMVSPASFEPSASGEVPFGPTLKGVGAGPYQLKTFDANTKTVMARFDAYWAGTKGRPAGFEHHYVPDSRARFNALRSGQATISLIEPRQIPEAKALGLTVLTVEKNALWDIYLNVSRPQLKDVRVRRALMHAIDREAIADAMGYGSARPTQQLWAPSSPFFIKELDSRYPFDQGKARALLAEAGYRDGVEITMLLLNTTEYRALAEALQGMLREVGITLKFDLIDVSQYTQFSRPVPRGDIMVARNGGRGDAVEGLAQIVGTGGGVNPGGPASPRIDELLGIAKRLRSDDPKRLAVMLDLSREISEQVGNVPVITRANVYAFKPGCILNLLPYMPAGDERFNDVQVGAACK